MILLIAIGIYIASIFIARFIRKFWYDEPDKFDYILWFIPFYNTIYIVALLIIITADFISRKISQKIKVSRIFKWFFNYEKLK